MTRGEAQHEARHRWGPTAEAREFAAGRQTGAPPFIEVGTYDTHQNGITYWNERGAGRTFQAAFANADSRTKEGA